MLPSSATQPGLLRLPFGRHSERRWLLRATAATELFRCHSTKVDNSAASSSKRFSDTLLLPKTSFPVRHKNVVAAEVKVRERVTSEYYKEQWEKNQGPVFLLHDGPPYANGNLHMGHALNKLLKDFINRYKAKKGYRVKYIPGWDCHGLPIEHKALKSLGKSHLALSPQAVRQAARKTALDAIEVQKGEFRQLGIMADWDSPGATYRTLDRDFEIRQLKILRKMLQRGLIQHRRRPTFYSPSSRTALAEAELSYKDDHKSHSVYVVFDVPQPTMSRGLAQIVDRVAPGAKIGLAVWTTTPWTLTANQAVAIGKDIEYALVKRSGSERLLVIAKDRVSALERHLGSMEILETIMGDYLIGTEYSHLFCRAGLPAPQIIQSKYVTVSAGTGLVHSAPGHGQEDYEVYREAYSDRPETEDIRCPVDDEGNLTEEILNWTAEGVEAGGLVGKAVLGDAVPMMVELLKVNGVLLAEEPIQHRYPCDWKTKEPIIIRATPQWFADVGAIKEDAIAALTEVTFKPESARRRLEAFVLGRSEWCISRQRSWGVPIPVLYDVVTGDPVLSPESLDHIINVLGDKGTDYWWSDDVAPFLTPELLASGRKYRKGTDTMDVWFDSGSSWTLIEEMGLRTAEKPVTDMYLEGSDQHRGWFQSSLLTHISASEGKEARTAPYKELVTHGFVLDQEGQKMSKSLGNGLTPIDIIHGGKDRTKLPSYGTDVLRLWAAGVDYTRDVGIGATSLAAAAENMRKIRNVMKFLLGNIRQHVSEVKSSDACVPTLVDRYVLHETAALQTTADKHYQNHDFNRVLQSVNSYMASTLSAFYFDLSKDILYSDASNSPRRTAVVAVMTSVTHTLKDIIAPLTPHLVAEIEDHLTAVSQQRAEAQEDISAAAKMRPLLDIRQHVLHLLEDARLDKHIGSPSEACLVIEAQADGSDLSKLFAEEAELLPILFGVSSVTVETGRADSSLDRPAETSWCYSERCDVVGTAENETAMLSLAIKPSVKHKCPRCWRHVADQPDSLCGRCAGVINRSG